jgi:hypothetical protein
MVARAVKAAGGAVVADAGAVAIAKAARAR